jgi:hypothetical protein
MKKFICLAGFMIMSAPAAAAMYKCTDAEGNVGFSDKPCPGQKQEALEERSAPVSASSPDAADAAVPDSDAAETQPAAETGAGVLPDIEPIRALVGGTRVTGASPLGKVYASYLGALRQCNRNEMMKHVSSGMAAEMSASPEPEFREGCRLLLMLLPQDFTDATEVIRGDRGTIQWLSIETKDAGSGTSTMKFEQSQDFVMENGAWKLSE